MRTRVGKKPTAGPQEPRDRREHRVELHVVQRHDCADDVEPADRADVFDPLLDQRRAPRRLRVDAHGVNATRRQALDKPAVAEADVENSRAEGYAIGDDRVKAAPPTIVSHVRGRGAV